MSPNTVYDVTLFGLDFAVKPVAFTIPVGEGWNVYWYGILISVGFLLALLYAFKNAPRFELDVDRMIDVILVATPVAILSARLYYVIFSGVPWKDFFKIHEGGLAIYGGLIGAFLAGLLMCKLRKINVLAMFDLASPGFLLAQSVGRWGNFVNQEAYGGPTGSEFWGMTGTRIRQDTFSDDLVHPCFLYESVWCLLGFALLHFYSRRRKLKWNGELFFGYAVWYGFGRFFIESLRTDQLKMLGSIPVSMLVSALAFAAGLTLLLVFRSKAKAKALDNADYVPIFGELGAEGDSEAEPEEGEAFETDSEEQADNADSDKADDDFGESEEEIAEAEDEVPDLSDSHLDQSEDKEHD